MGKIVLFAGVDPLATGESDYAWHPLSVLTVGTALKAAGHEPVVIDCQIDAGWRQRLREQAQGALYVGVTCMTGPSIGNVLEAIDIVRAHAIGVPVVWGGYHASLAYGGIVGEGLAEVVVRGPGEAAAVALAELAQSGGSLTDTQALGRIPNLAFTDGRSELRGTGLRPRVLTTAYGFAVDPDTLPATDYSLVPVEAYYTEEVRDLSYISSFGCPHPCTFCSEPQTSLRRWKALGAERVVTELEALWKRYTPDQISLLDPNFSTNTARVIEIVELMERRGLCIQLRANMRAKDVVALARHIDLARLRDVGFSAIFVGCESGSDRMLKLMRKQATVKDTVDGCRMLSAAGIVQLTSWIHDLPEESEEDSALTLRLLQDLARLPHNQQKHHFFTPFPATEMYEALFGATEDDGRTQRQWAQSDTYAASPLWAGRPDFRRRVLEELEDLQREHPAVLVRSLPRLAAH
ncbi:radical SAM protein [Streptacidiphilus sp. EB103A]|uniref:B12-binding domain-containing radical SAM protein n=1 Tax=Streptacidiphilus sp. EB103A TaxID=3156275 RepID=UPI003512E758